MNELEEKQLLSYVKQRDIDSLNAALEATSYNIASYILIQDFLNKHAQELTDKYTLTSKDFAFQELLYLIERDALEGSILSASQVDLVKQIRESNGLKIPMMIFEILTQNHVFDAKVISLCFERLIEKRSVMRVLEVLDGAPEDFWFAFGKEVARKINADFIYVNENIRIMEELQRIGYDIFPLTDEQKVFYLRYKGLSEDLLKAHPDYIALACQTNTFDWLGNWYNDEVLDIVVVNTTDWNVLLGLKLGDKFREDLKKAVLRSSNIFEPEFLETVLSWFE